jgi:hypothetical protein
MGHEFSQVVLDASNDVHSGFMVYKALMKMARSARTRLMPERYTADLANELGRRGDDPISQTRGDDNDASALTLSRRPRKPPPLHFQAYTLWRQGHGLLNICIRMRDRSNPQSETVVMYICIRSSSKRNAC